MTITTSSSVRSDYVYKPFGLTRKHNVYVTYSGFGFSTKYEDGLPLLYFGYRYLYGDNRWLSRDSIEESGGANLYGVCGQDLINRIDKLGRDFIAISDRPVKGLSIMNLAAARHYSLQYWKAPDHKNIRRHQIYSVDEFNKRPNCAKLESVELLNNVDNASKIVYSLRSWFYGPRKGDEGDIWQSVNAGVAIINYSDSGSRFAPVFFALTENEVKKKWDEIIGRARGYRFAEQQERVHGFPMWPRSEYGTGIVEDGMGFSTHPNFNNSNTFVRLLMKFSKIDPFELPGRHQGVQEAVDHMNTRWWRYGREKPRTEADPLATMPNYTPHQP